MNTLIAEYWIWLVVALILGLIVAWYVFHASRRTKVTGTSNDVLDEGAQRAERNRALIDSAPAATREQAPTLPPEPDTDAAPITPIAAPTGLAGSGAAVAAAADEAELEQRDAATESVLPAAPPATHPTPPATPAPAPALKEKDDLNRIKGIGPKLSARLQELGVTSFAQIAAWNNSDIDRIDAELGRFQGRIRRDDWIEQARLLNADETSAYEAKFGRLD